ACRATAIPLSVTEPAQRAALAALENEHEYRAQAKVLGERRDRIRDALRAQGWAIPEPQGNFVWLATGAQTAAAAETLEQHGIVGRVFAGEGIRVTVGEEESVASLIEAAGKVVRTL
ncbi:MAG TPA: aminotransferase class I/II-fold pyridoxal phosphate-dependent enzyme, partial [Protaetiibacter sp.]|nr:aminotransferase class I/II-fold pyridoxal phosphate-dependent enzyme [Protaetiibacter sp.]